MKILANSTHLFVGLIVVLKRKKMSQMQRKKDEDLRKKK